jgi:ribonuclease HI
LCKIYIDGGSRGNPGEGAIGFTVLNSENEEVFRFGKRIGPCTNNYAEYYALIEALEYIVKNCLSGCKNVEIYSDSELLVKQINNVYKVKSGNLIPLFKKARDVFDNDGRIRIMHINREKNRTADWIVNRVLDEKPYELTS